MPGFLPRWSNRKALRVGYLTGRGLQSHEIAAILADGTTAATVRRMWYLARLEKVGRRRNTVPIVIELTAYQRKALGLLASAKGLSADEWLRRVASAAIKDNLYNAIVDETEPAE